MESVSGRVPLLVPFLLLGGLIWDVFGFGFRRRSE